MFEKEFSSEFHRKPKQKKPAAKKEKPSKKAPRKKASRKAVEEESDDSTMTPEQILAALKGGK